MPASMTTNRRQVGILFCGMLAMIACHVRSAEAVPYDPGDPTMARLELAATPRQLGPGDDYPGMWEYVYDFYHAAGTFEMRISLEGFDVDGIANLHDIGDGLGLYQYWDRNVYGAPVTLPAWFKFHRPSYWSGVGDNWELPSEGACVGCDNEAYEYINEWHSPFDYHADVFYGFGAGVLEDNDALIAGNDALRFNTHNPSYPNQFNVEGLGLTFRVVHPNAPGAVNWSTYHWNAQDIEGWIVGPGAHCLDPPAVPEPSTYAMAVLGLIGLLAYRRRR